MNCSIFSWRISLTSGLSGLEPYLIGNVLSNRSSKRTFAFLSFLLFSERRILGVGFCVFTFLGAAAKEGILLLLAKDFDGHGIAPAVTYAPGAPARIKALSDNLHGQNV